MRDGALIPTWICPLKSLAKIRLLGKLTTPNTTIQVPNQSTTKFSLTKCLLDKKLTSRHWKNTFLCVHKCQPTTKRSWIHEKQIEWLPREQTVQYQGVWSPYLTQKWRKEINKAKLLWCHHSTKTSPMNFTICQGREKSCNKSPQGISFLVSSIIKAKTPLRNLCKNFLNKRRPSLLIRCREMQRHRTKLIGTGLWTVKNVKAQQVSNKCIFISDEYFV